jgi:hypothetical protein
MAEDLSSKVAENVTKPASASNDSGSMEQHTLRDQIEALKFFENRKAISGKNRGILFSKCVPPGASS